MEQLRASVIELLEASKWQECVQLLQQAHQEQRQSEADLNITQEWVGSKEAAQALLIASLHVYCSKKEWSKALRIGTALSTSKSVGNTTATSESSAGVHQPQQVIQQAHRRAAALVHPDKCKLPHAAEAFKLAGKARDELLGQHAQHTGGSRPTKRSRTSHQAHGRATASPSTSRQPDGSVSEDDQELLDEDFWEEEPGYNWWDPWDAAPKRTEPQSNPLSSNTAARHENEGIAIDEAQTTEQGMDTTAAGARQLDGSTAQHHVSGCKGSGDGSSSHGTGGNLSPQQEEECTLWTMPIEELSELVKQRQAGLLVSGVKTAGSSHGHPQLNMFQRQKQLRATRSVLAARLSGQGVPKHVQELLAAPRQNCAPSGVGATLQEGLPSGDVNTTATTLPVDGKARGETNPGNEFEERITFNQCRTDKFSAHRKDDSSKHTSYHCSGGFFPSSMS